MKVIELEAENILSIGHINLSFGNSGLVLLDGWNHDDNSHNGAGKTSIFNALSFAIYNKLPRKVTASEILRKGCKTGYARAVVQVGKDVYDIKRGRPTSFSVSKNGVAIPEMTQEQLELLIGLTYEQFLICMYSAQTESVKLIALNDSAKKDFFLRLLSLEDFAERKKLVDGLIKTKTTELYDLQLTYGKVEAKIAAYNEDVADVQDLLVSKAAVLADRAKLVNEINTLSNTQRPDMSKFDKLEASLNMKLRDISAAEVKINTARSMIKRISLSIKNMDDNSITCPHCDNSFAMGTDGPTTKEHLEKELASHVEVVNTLSAVVDEKQGVADTLQKLKQKRASALSDYESVSDTISEHRSSLRVKEMMLASLEEKITKQDELAVKITNARKALAALGTKVAAFKDELLIYEAISSALSPTGAPAYVVDSVIEKFNDNVSQYVSLVWPNASYSLQSYKENKSGDIKAKFSDKLTINGVDRSIGSLSGGELRCLSLAVDFAVIDIVESTFGISMNPIILDEPFEGLDALNRERVIEVLESISADRQIWVIDHASEAKSMFSTVVKVEKRDGISSIA